MKLVVQIPAFNEEGSLAAAIAALPKSVEGFDSVEVLVIDDGSSDGTSEVARRSGAAEVVRFPAHRGLAAAFTAGIEASLRRGADCIVNFDADNQYVAADLPLLVAPILRGEADLVVGDRQTHRIPHFSPAKKFLQAAGSWVVRQASSTNVPDATSGFRALSRHAAESVHVFSRLTYTLETLIQAGSKGLRIASVPVRTNPPVRPSRLIPSTAKYVALSGANILRITALYKPLKVFSAAAALFLASGLALVLRYGWLYATGRNPAGHVQSLIVAAILIVVGAQTFLIALLADLVSINRTLLEELKERASGSSTTSPAAGSERSNPLAR